MSGEEDGHIHDYFRRTAFPDEAWVEAILQALEESDGLGIRELETALNLRYGQIDKALKFLSVEDPAPVARIDGKWRRTPVPYRLDRERIRRLTEQREMEWNEVQRYIDHRGCLMEFLTGALDDPDPEPCGKCAPCLGRPVVSPSHGDGTLPLAARFLERSELELVCNPAAPRGRLRRVRPARTSAGRRARRDGAILARWGDPGWGVPSRRTSGAAISATSCGRRRRDAA